MFIMKAKPHDFEEILILQRKAYRSEAELYDDFTIPPMTETVKEFLKVSDKTLMLKAEISGKIVGSIRATEEDGIINVGRLIVDPDYQGKGIGTTLLLEIEKYFRDATLFELFTGIKSYSNIRLYEKNGYMEHRREQLSDKVTLVYFRKDRSLINS